MNGVNDKNQASGVSLLAAGVRRQRKSDVRALFGDMSNRLIRTLPGLTASFLLVLTQATWATDWHSTAEIRAAAEEFVRSEYGKDDSRFAPVAGNLDRRLRLHQCNNALQAFVRKGSRVGNRAIVGVRCPGPKPWKVYVPVEIVVTESVLIAIKTLPKGHTPTADDVRSEERDISRMTGGYLSNVAELDGQRLKHQVVSGRAITPAMLSAKIVIHRGQSVTLIVRNDQMSISMAGKALADRARNQRIRVENLGSGRIVEGIVRSAEVVEVLVR